MPHRDPHALARQLRADGYFDNEVDAQLAAIKLLATASSLEPPSRVTDSPNPDAEADRSDCDAAAIDEDPDAEARRYELKAMAYQQQSRELQRKASEAWQCAERARAAAGEREQSRNWGN